MEATKEMSKFDFIAANQLYGLHERAENLIRQGKGPYEEINGKKGIGTWELLMEDYYEKNEVYIKLNALNRENCKTAYDFLVKNKMLETHPTRIFYYKFLPLEKIKYIKLIYKDK